MLRSSRRTLADLARGLVPLLHGNKSATACCAHFVSSSEKHSPDQQPGPDISLLSPLLQSQFNHARNADLGNKLIKPHSNSKVWWDCDQCPDGHTHQWEATVYNRSKGTGCPLCNRKAVCQHNSLATKAPAIAAQFSHENHSTAHDYTFSSSKVVTWQCDKGHEWRASINNRRHGKKGCPACFAYRNSFHPKMKHPVLTDSQHSMMQYWDWELNNKAYVDPREIRCRSHKKANWICHQCPNGQPHRWQAAVGTMYSGSGCPCCSGKQACTCNSLQSLYPEVAAEWDGTRNTGTPKNYTAHSKAKVWWHNSKRGHFLAIINDRTRRQSPTAF